MFFLQLDIFENRLDLSFMFLNELVRFLESNSLDVGQIVASSHDAIDHKHVKCKGVE